MRIFLVLLLILTSLASANDDTTPDNITTLQQLLEMVEKDGLREASINKEREALFLKDVQTQKKELANARQELKRVKNESNRLKATFDTNEEDLAGLEDELRKRLGNLGEMFGVVRQVSQDVSSIREHSLIANEIGGRSELLSELSESKALPSIKQLEKLWYEMQLQMTKQGEAKSYTSTYLNQKGEKLEGDIFHLGPFIAFTKTGFLNFDANTQYFVELSKQPSQLGLIERFIESDSGFSDMVIDPTRGTLLNLGSQSPDLMDRIEQGGLIGLVILLLAGLGFVYAIFLLYKLLTTQSKVNRQLTNIESPNLDNPLGRILSAYQGERSEKDLETLEMKLDEAVMKELPELEKGLSTIKLLAAVAPLLGLLGTVTGMIATFQSITLFGTGDPKLMAGGISQALITTVLGLVCAIPLLFMHNILNSRSKNMIQILDQQSAGMIAEHAQKGA